MSDCSSLDVGKILRKLAEYEDTNLSPEEINDMKKKIKALYQIIGGMQKMNEIRKEFINDIERILKED